MGESKRALRQRMHRSLKELHLHLQVVYAGVVVTATALRGQNAEQDREIACVLKYCVGDRLAEEMDRTAALLASLRSGEPPAAPGRHPRRAHSARKRIGRSR